MSYSTFYLNSQSSGGIIDGSNVIIGGNVGIQTNAPVYSLDVSGSFRSSSIVTSNLNTENIILTDSSLNPYSIQSRIEHTKLVENIVTVGAKTSDAANSSGSSNAFFIDNIETPYLHFTLGKKYRFIQTDSTNTGHPLRFYLDEGKTTQFTTNVTVLGTPGVDTTAYVEILVTSSTPQILYYQCSSHSYMGNTAYSKSTDLTGIINGADVSLNRIDANSIVINGDISANDASFNVIDAATIFIEGSNVTTSLNSKQPNIIESMDISLNNLKVHGDLSANDASFNVVEAATIFIEGSNVATSLNSKQPNIIESMDISLNNLKVHGDLSANDASFNVVEAATIFIEGSNVTTSLNSKQPNIIESMDISLNNLKVHGDLSANDASFNVVEAATIFIEGSNVATSLNSKQANIIESMDISLNNLKVHGDLSANDASFNVVEAIQIVINGEDLSSTIYTKINTDIEDAISDLVDNAPLALDTLNELAQALNDDANFYTTITNSLNSKQVAITESVDVSLNNLKVHGDLSANDVSFNVVEAASIFIEGSNITTSLNSKQATITESVDVSLNNLKVHGDLSANDVSFNVVEAASIFIEGSNITTLLNSKQTTITESVDVSLNNLKVHGDLSANDASFNVVEAASIFIEDSNITTSLNSKQEAITESVDVSLNNLKVHGDLSANDVSFNVVEAASIFIEDSNITTSLNSKQATITESVDVSLNNLKVHGDLSANDASFNVIDVSAIFIEGSNIISSLNGGGSSVWSSPTDYGSTDIYYTGGNVGIGTDDPDTKLDVFGGEVKFNTHSITVIEMSESDGIIKFANLVKSINENRSPHSNNTRIYVDGNLTNLYNNTYNTNLTQLPGTTHDGGSSYYYSTTSRPDDQSTLDNIIDLITDKTIFKDGNVGIGTTSPAYKLDVSGNSRFMDDVSMNSNLYVQGTSKFVNNVGIGANPGLHKLAVYGTSFFTDNISMEGNLTVDNYVGIGTAASNTYRLNVNGNANFSGDVNMNDVNMNGNLTVDDYVGIGTTANSSYRLHVDGNARFTGDVSMNSKLQIDGNVGINTAPGNVPLTVEGDGTTNAPVFRCMNHVNGFYVKTIRDTSPGSTYSDSLNYAFRCDTATGAGAITVLNNHSVGIGTHTGFQNHRLRIVGESSSSNPQIYATGATKGISITNSGTSTYSLSSYSGFFGGGPVQISGYYTSTATGTAGRLTASSTITVLNQGALLGLYVNKGIFSGANIYAASDRRIKNNIVDVPDHLALTYVRNIPCCYYNYIDRPNQTNTIGFIAQEVKEIFPIAVSTTTKCIPNIMQTISGEWIERDDGKYDFSSNFFTDISFGTYKFYLGQDISDTHGIEKDLSMNDDRTFTFEKTHHNVYCYGIEIDDFHILDKAKLFALNFSATQELDRIQQQHQLEIESLKLINQDMNQQLNDVLDENNRLKNDIQFIKNYLGIN